jgi:serine/threonine protein kinase
MEVIARHRKGDASPLTQINEDASPEVSNLIERMMAVDPAERPQTMEAVRDEVKTLLESC